MNAVSNLRVPLTYWGGKQILAGRIVPLLAKHLGYVEPFCGGAAVFWRKLPSKWEAPTRAGEALVNRASRAKQELATLATRIAS